jgi:hypothetical protein
MPSPTCGQCGFDPNGVANTVMVPMQPGHDGKPWSLCVGCWIEGRRPWKLGRFKVTVIEDPKLADALSAASKRGVGGLIDMGELEERSAAKSDVGDFKRTPPKAERSRPRRA